MEDYMGAALIWFALGLLGFLGWLAKKAIDFLLDTFKLEIQVALRRFFRHLFC
jgi:hypothetical protein